MKTSLIISIVLFSAVILFTSDNLLYAQSKQTIRGQVLDEVSQTPLIGVSVIVVSNSNTLGSTTDEEGNYRIDNVPVGRQTIKITYIGYEEQTIPNVVVTAGKEVVMNISLVESVKSLNE